MEWLKIAATLGIPSMFVGLFLWRIQCTIIRAEKRNDDREKVRERHNVMMIRGVHASIALGEATACALRDGHCNGQVTSALEYAQKAKHEQKEFLEEQAIKNLI